MMLFKKPVLCNYYVTYRCNATCSFCDIWEKPSPYIKLEDVEQNLKDLKKLGVKVIDFTGGEPLLHRELHKMLRMAKDSGFITTITTNTLLYPKYGRRLQGLVDMLHFSLDYADAAKHDEARGVRCFQSVMESITIAKSLGEQPDILFTAFKDNLYELPAVYEICLNHDLVLIINPAFSYNAVDSKDDLSEEELDYLRSWGAKKNVYLNEGFIELRKNGGNDITNPVCRAGSTTIVISPENKLVLPCYHLGLKEYDIDNNLYHLYQTEEIQSEITMEGRHEKCAGCTINCYMQPSFAVNINKYWFLALPSTLKYNKMKGTWKSLLGRSKKNRASVNDPENLDVSLSK